MAPALADQLRMQEANEVSVASEEALKKTSREMKKMLRKMEKELESTRAVVDMVREERENVKSLDKAILLPMKGNKKCQAMRSGNHTEDVNHDDVLKQLNIQAKELLTSQAYYAQLLGALSSMKAQLTQTVQTLEVDIASKKESLQLDLEALMLNGEGQKDCVQDNSRAWLSRGHWSHVNDEMLQHSATIRYEGQRICSKSSSVCAERKAMHDEMRATVVDICRSRIDQARTSGSDLDQRLAQTRAELKKANETRNAIEDALKDKARPLQTARERLYHRQQRPAREQVRDEAEDALQVEVQELTSLVKDLKIRRSQVEADIKDLESLKQELKELLRARGSSARIDQLCVELQMQASGEVQEENEGEDAQESQCASQPSGISQFTRRSSGTPSMPRPLTGTTKPPSGFSSRLGGTQRSIQSLMPHPPPTGSSVRSGLGGGSTHRSLGGGSTQNIRHAKPPSTARSFVSVEKYENNLGGTQSLASRGSTGAMTARGGSTGAMTARGKVLIEELSRMHTPASDFRQISRQANSRFSNASGMQTPAINRMHPKHPDGKLRGPVTQKVSRERIKPKKLERPISTGPWQSAAPLKGSRPPNHSHRH